MAYLLQRLKGLAQTTCIETIRKNSHFVVTCDHQTTFECFPCLNFMMVHIYACLVSLAASDSQIHEYGTSIRSNISIWPSIKPKLITHSVVFQNKICNTLSYFTNKWSEGSCYETNFKLNYIRSIFCQKNYRCAIYDVPIYSAYDIRKAVIRTCL